MSSDRAIRRVAVWTMGACALVLAGSIGAALVPAAKSWIGGTPPPPPPAYTRGERIDLPAELYAASPRTLLVFAESQCAACQGSKPVLAAIASDLRESPVRLVLISSNSAPTMQKDFGRELGIDPDDVHLTDLTRLRVKRVPAVVLVDDRGTVLFAKEGLLVPEDRQLIHSTLATPPPNT